MSASDLVRNFEHTPIGTPVGIDARGAVTFGSTAHPCRPVLSAFGTMVAIARAHTVHQGYRTILARRPIADRLSWIDVTSTRSASQKRTLPSTHFAHGFVTRCATACTVVCVHSCACLGFRLASTVTIGWPFLSRQPHGDNTNRTAFNRAVYRTAFNRAVFPWDCAAVMGNPLDPEKA